MGFEMKVKKYLTILMIFVMWPVFSQGDDVCDEEYLSIYNNYLYYIDNLNASGNAGKLFSLWDFDYLSEEYRRYYPKDSDGEFIYNMAKGIFVFPDILFSSKKLLSYVVDRTVYPHEMTLMVVNNKKPSYKYIVVNLNENGKIQGIMISDGARKKPINKCEMVMGDRVM
ncbi:hypothetical protein [Pseudoalteromonas luteoviolacea]|uniref:hypothetical protein n=1 Tax=Pseudoalteromonas luteoviolacea TaxID=43657 RepID=UPI001152C26F|nr:hypothetical protein [Pseudoalteromonas luteoviolacea]TQF71263.1 hypothetical protein FLM44_09275 [Pseudoalteromonas luteoviolacea]